MFFKNKYFFLVLLSVLVFYIIALVCFYLFSNRLIFQRITLSKEFEFKFEQTHKEYLISLPDGTSINALFFKSPTTSKGLIFYLHGNADNLDRWGKFAGDFTSLGYDVLMYDYRGYGKSSGTPNDHNIYEDAAFLLNWTKENIPYTKLVIYGRSIGAAIASELAINNNPHLLILETPFANFSDAIYWPLKPALFIFPVNANFSNENTLPKVTCTKVIFHGTKDWVVPLSSAEKLKVFINKEDRFITIPGGGHRNLNKFELYHKELADILK